MTGKETVKRYDPTTRPVGISEHHQGYRDLPEYRSKLLELGRPFALITVLAFGLSVVAARDPTWPQFVAGWVCALGGLALAFSHPSFWLAAPFGALGGALLVRSGTDGLESGVGPLLLIPVLAIAIYGSRRSLVVMLGAVAAAILTIHFVTHDTALVVTPVWRQDLMLLILASILGVALHEMVSRLRGERLVSERRREQLELVSRITRTVATRPDPSRALCEMAVELTDARGAALYRRTPDGTGLLAWEGGSHEQLVELGTTAVSAALDRFRREPDPDDLHVYRAGDPELDLCAPAWVGFEVGAIVCAAARSENEIIGILLLAWPVGVDPVDSVVPLDMLSAEASIAIRKHDLTDQLERLATTDPLTGIDNRRGWDRMIAAAFGRSRRYSQPLCLAMLDLDGFKAYNDRHGHRAGDALLRRCAATWQRLIRVDDHLARYGGDEFLVTLPHTGLDEAMEVIERLRTAVPDEAGCSAGVSVWDGAEPVDRLLERADQALYLAKQDGAGRVRSAPAG